ncbi:lipoprotein LpqH [Mycobacterium sp. ACS4054]|uniref:lipoprotein LpqH n=1 Tax=Mycobacterium sp. ACS4054 TaxID=1834119 RepID=UPI000A4F1CE4|nr:lipoprotein LpqH [Mycobacterium sp. ACS4054]
MPDRRAAAVVAALAVALLGACSSRPPSQIASTASVTIDGNDRNFHIVKCGQLEWTRTIDIGGDFSGAKVVIDESAQQPAATSVHIRNLGGFSGMYSRGGDGNADTSMSGGKYTISGTANGYKTDKPGEPASASFKITVTC